MRQRIFSIFISLCLVLSMMPMTAGTAFAAGHSHCVCGKSSTTAVSGHTHAVESEFTEWNSTDSLPTAAGNYYLTVDVTMQGTTWVWEPADGTVLCLNGHTVTFEPATKPELGQGANLDAIHLKGNQYNLSKAVEFTLTDCQSSQGKITGNTRNFMKMEWNATFNMYGGKISGLTTESGIENASGTINLYGGEISGNNVSRNDESVIRSRNPNMSEVEPNINMYGGKVSGNSAMYACISVESGKFTMSGGEISGNNECYKVVDVDYDGTFEMSGDSKIINNVNSNTSGSYAVIGVSNKFYLKNGTISGNKYARIIGLLGTSSEFNMSGGTVKENAPTLGTNALSGGAVYNDEGTVTITDSAKISDNNASSNGGGIYNEKGTVTVSGNAEISGNKASASGGGIHNAGGTVTVTGAAKISNNTASSNGGGIANAVLVMWPGETFEERYTGTLNLSGGTVSGNSSGSTANGGGIYNECSLTVNGPVTVKNNTKGTGTDAPANNLYTNPAANKLTLQAYSGDNADAEYEADTVGISAGTLASLPTVFTADGSTNIADYKDVFFADDDANYEVDASDDNGALRLNTRKYSLKWELNGGTIKTGTTYTPDGRYDKDTPIVAPGVPNIPTDPEITKSDGYDYTFEGWYKDKDLLQRVNDTQWNNMKLTADTTFYAKYTKSSAPKSFDITYELGSRAKYNGSSTITENYTYSETDTHTLNAGTGLTLDKGYEFKGWYANSNFSGSPVTNIAAKEYGDKTYYAKIAPLPAEVPASVTISWKPVDCITITDGVNATIIYGTYGTSDVSTTMTRTGGTYDPNHYSYTYTWYKNSTNSSSGGKLISGAEKSTYEVPPYLAASTNPYYYYCILKATRKDNGEYATVATNPVKLTVTKATALVNEAPTAKSDLEYTGADQELLATGGKGNLANENDSAMEYACTQEEIAETETEKINALTYSTAIPTAVNAGTYYVWYRAAVSTAHANNYNASAAKCLTVTIDKATPSAPTGLVGAAPTTIADDDGKITGISQYTTGNSQVEYTKLASDTDAPTTSSTWTKCTGREITGLSAGTYYVRYSADSNHDVGAHAKVTVPVTPDRNITIKDNTAVAKVDDIETSKAKGGKSVTITANIKKGYDFSRWLVVYGDNKDVTVTPTVGAQQPTATFTMPAADVTVEALYTPAALTGTASIDGTTTFGYTLVAKLSDDNNNTGNLTYQWYRGDTAITMAKSPIYTLLLEDIGKTIKVEIGSSVQTGTRGSNATATIRPDVLTGISDVGYDAAYDGSAHGITLTGVPEDAAVTYSNTGAADSYTMTTAPTYTNFTNGAKTVYYKVSKAGYEDFTGAADVNITKADGEVTTLPTGAVGLFRNGKEQQLITSAGEGTGAMLFALEKEGTYAEDISLITGKDAGTYTIWYKAAESANYKATEPQSITVKIGMAGLSSPPMIGDDEPQTPDDDDSQSTTIATIKDKVAKFEFVARSSKTAKNNIKVVLNIGDETKADIKAIEDMGYTVKYKFYRSVKKTSKYTSKVTKTSTTYTNTSGVKGKMYYYKARVQVFDKDGKLVAQTELKQCKYANRKWTK